MMEKKLELGLVMSPSYNDLEKKRIHLGGGEERFRNSDFIISIHRSHIVKNPKIKIIRSKYTPSNDK